MKKICLSNNLIFEIINLYQSGLSCISIGNQFNLSGEYIRKLLKSNDFSLRESHEINNKYQVNESFFDQIDSQEKAYFLGLLFADGNVSSSSNAVNIKLQEKDKNILIRLSHMIFGQEILYKSKNNYVLKFSSKHIKNKLIELGCVPNKTFKLNFPNIDSKLYSHFIRGYFDGDGCLNCYKKNYTASLISTESFCNSIQYIIKNELGINCPIRKNKMMLARGNTITSIFIFQGNRKVLKFTNWLYQDTNLYFERKYKKYLNLKNQLAELDQRNNNL